MKDETIHKKGLTSDGHLDENSLAACAEWLNGGVDKLDVLLQNHLEKCGRCKQAVLEISELSNLTDTPVEPGKTANDIFEETCAAKYSPAIKLGQNNQFWRVAAVFLVLVTVAALTLVLKPKKDPLIVDNIELADSVAQKSDEKNLENLPALIDSTTYQKQEKPIIIETVDANLYAANFTPNPTYEALIGAQFRASSSPKVLNPGRDTSLIQGGLLTFKGNNPGKDKLEIHIIDNRAKQVKIFSGLDSISIDVKLDWDPGLYYWKLVGEDELYQVGKFTIIEQPN